MNSICRTLVIAVLALVAASAHAADPMASGSNNPGFHPVLGMDLTFGGDTISTQSYTDGSSSSTRAGGVVQLGGGVAWNSADMPISAQFTINYHVDNKSASNGTIKFERFPIEGLVFYTGVPNWRFGGGVRFVQSPKFSDSYLGNSADFKNAIGGVVEAGYSFGPGSWVTLRYVSEKYEQTTYNGTSLNGSNKIDGSHFGVGYQYEFH